MWRVGDVPDVFVRFDQSPVQLVFWRGTSFVPCWVTENGIWYSQRRYGIFLFTVDTQRFATGDQDFQLWTGGE